MSKWGKLCSFSIMTAHHNIIMLLFALAVTLFEPALVRVDNLDMGVRYTTEVVCNMFRYSVLTSHLDPILC